MGRGSSGEDFEGRGGNGVRIGDPELLLLLGLLSSIILYGGLPVLYYYYDTDKTVAAAKAEH